MKKLLLLLGLMAGIVSANAQKNDVKADRGIFNSLYLFNRWIDSIKTDTNFVGSTRTVPTSDAVARFVKARIEAASGGGGVETDPAFTASPAAGITGTNITNWTDAYNKKVVSTAFSRIVDTVYMTLTYQDGTTIVSSFIMTGGGVGSESDPTVPSHVKTITTTNIANWNTAFNYGPHAGLYARLDGAYNNPGWITGLPWNKITGTPTSLLGYGITDPVLLSSNIYSNPSWLSSINWNKIVYPDSLVLNQNAGNYVIHNVQQGTTDDSLLTIANNGKLRRVAGADYVSKNYLATTGAPMSGSYATVHVGPAAGGLAPTGVLNVYNGSTNGFWQLDLRTSYVGGKTFYFLNAGTAVLTIKTTSPDQIKINNTTVSQFDLQPGYSAAITTVGFYWYGYFTGNGTGTEADPLFSGSPASTITNTNLNQWTTAYNYGPHAGLYARLDGAYNNPSWITGLPWSKITGAPSYLTAESDPQFDTKFTSKTTSDLFEGTRLYFTNPRVLATPLTGFSATDTNNVTPSDNIITALGKLAARINRPFYIDSTMKGNGSQPDPLGVNTNVIGTGGSGGSTKAPLDLKIGTTTNAPLNGSNKIVLSGSIGYDITLEINDRRIPNVNYDGVYFTKSADTVFIYGTTFTTADRVHMEFVKTTGSVTLPSQGGGGSEQALNLSNASPTALTESPSATWSGNNTTGIAAKFLPANTDGYIVMDIPVQADGNLVAISLDVNNTAYNTIGQLAYSAYVDAGTIMRSNAGAPTSTGITFTAGANSKLKVNRTSGTVTVQYTTDGSTWNTAYTFGTTTTAALYPKFNIYGSSGTRKIVNPKGSASLQ